MVLPIQPLIPRVNKNLTAPQQGNFATLSALGANRNAQQTAQYQKLNSIRHGTAPGLAPQPFTGPNDIMIPKAPVTNPALPTPSSIGGANPGLPTPPPMGGDMTQSALGAPGSHAPLPASSYQSASAPVGGGGDAGTPPMPKLPNETGNLPSGTAPGTAVQTPQPGADGNGGTAANPNIPRAPVQAMPNSYKSKYGTSINTTGLNAQQYAQVKALADGKYGTKAAALAAKFQSQIPQVPTGAMAADARLTGTGTAPTGKPNKALTADEQARFSYYEYLRGQGKTLTPEQQAEYANINKIRHGVADGQTGAAAPATNTPGTPPPGQFDNIANGGGGTPPATDPGVPPPPTGDPAPGAPGTPAAGTPAANTALANALFPNSQSFKDANGNITYQGSPLYDWSVQQGLKQVDSSLAARGLTGSGEGIRQEVNVPLQAAADTQLATTNAQNNASRLSAIQENEAQRQTDASNSQWGRLMDLLNFGAGQSPWNAAVAGVGSSADATTAAGQAQAQAIADAYQRIFASSGGGGAPAPQPTGPNYTNILPSQIAGNGASASGWDNIITGLIGSLFPSVPSK